MEEYGCRGPGYDLRRDFYPLVLKFKKLDESLARFEISPLDYLISLVTLFDHMTICYHINKIHYLFFSTLYSLYECPPKKKIVIFLK
jgi:hypothetical protein